MTLPKTWGEINQRRLAHQVIEWDGTATIQTVALPLTTKPVHVAVDNQSGQTLALTLAHLLRIDDTNASAKVGEGANSFYTVSVDEPGADGEKYSIQHVLPVDTEGETDLEIDLTDNLITITLAVDADGNPDNNKNTAILIAGAINQEGTGLKGKGFTAKHDGTGSGVFAEATEPIGFTGGTTERWASLYDADGNALSISIADKIRRVYGPYYYFPRYLGGRVTLTAGTEPENKTITVVQIVEG